MLHARNWGAWLQSAWLFFLPLCVIAANRGLKCLVKATPNVEVWMSIVTISVATEPLVKLEQSKSKSNFPLFLGKNERKPHRP